MSESGQGVLSYLLGFTWSMLEKDSLDPRVLEYGDLLARECRVDGGTEILDSLLNEILLPSLNPGFDPKIRVESESLEPAENVDLTIEPVGRLKA